MANGHTARQVFDLPELQPLIVTEHRAHGCLRARRAARRHEPLFSKTVTAPVQYGAAVSRLSWSICCTISCRARKASGRVDGRSVPGVNLVTATIASMSRAQATRFQGFVAAMRDLLVLQSASERAHG